MPKKRHCCVHGDSQRRLLKIKKATCLLAATAFDKQLLIAQGAAFGENVAARLVGKQVEEKKKNKKTKTKAVSSAPARPLLVPSQRRPVRPLQLPLLFFSLSASVSSATVSFPTRTDKSKHDNL